MQVLSKIRKKWDAKFGGHKAVDTLQVCFVAFVWIVLFVILLSIQGCAQKPDDAPILPTWTVKGTRDLKISNVVYAKDLTDVRTLTLKLGAKILVEDAPLILDLEELISDDGTIQSFASETAQRGMSGQSGRQIRIRAKRARGNLNIMASGQHGGEGQDGTNGRDGAQGPQGVPGIYDVKPDDQLPIPKSAQERVDLKAYYLGKKHGDVNARWDLWFFCSQQTGDGGQGVPGEYGHDGQKGGDGGNSSPVFLQIEEGERFQAHVTAELGRGALGGRGGSGGTGGPSGPPGVRDNGDRCREASLGTKGADGLAGRPGELGKSGKKNSVCVQINNQVSGECSK